MTPFSSMFSRPVSSGWKPAPSSSSGATLPRTVQRSGGGLEDPAHQAKQGALAGAVAAKQRHRLAVTDGDIDPLQRDHHLLLRPRPREEHRLEGAPLQGEQELLSERARLDYGHLVRAGGAHQPRSARAHFFAQK